MKFFLEQCLCSVEKAINNILAEVWVVDNASKDGSVEYLSEKFSFVKFIINEENTGFAKANNFALDKCSGEYVLFLNPDTIMPEDCLEKCLKFLDNIAEPAALGIRMIDGSGRFLPESKRAFPSPITSLFKLTGLTSLFPRSKIFARYSLGYLDEFKNHEVDVLSGAFLMAKRKVLIDEKGFDETFFMYGEDVDLSYRLQKAGGKNYYFSESAIIHFKGESTKKGSLNYVKMFYHAMSIFVRKHYSGGKANIFNFFIQIAIWFRAVFAVTFQMISKISLPVLDVIIILGSFLLVNSLWIHLVREGHGFAEGLLKILLPGFTLVFLASATLAGIYDKFKPARTFYASLFAIIIMLAAYSLLPEKFRFSRSVIVIGGLTAAFLLTFLRWLLLKVNVLDLEDETDRQQKTLIIGTISEYNNVLMLLKNAGLHERILGRIATNGSKEEAIGTLDQLTSLIKTLSIKEVIFCEGDLSFESIINALQTLPHDVSARFHARKSTSIIGSDSKDASGEFVSTEDLFKLSNPYQRRMKRIVDVVFSLFILLTFPIQLIIKASKIKAAALVFIGRKTWVGYTLRDKKLPLIPEGILAPTGQLLKYEQALNNESLSKIDYWYAKEYYWLQDVKLVIMHYRRF